MLGSSIQIGGGGADVSAGITTTTSWLLKPSGDTDDYFEFLVTANRPLFRAVGSYLVLGADTTTSHSLPTPGIIFGSPIEFDSYIYFDSNLYTADTQILHFGTGEDVQMSWVVTDTDANAFNIQLPAGSATNVPAIITYRDPGTSGNNLGLLDGITQPLFSILEKVGQLHSATDGIADAGAASAILKHVGGFTAAVVGDRVRITAGTNCTAGWYWITTVTSADQVTLDRNYTSGNTTNVTFVTYHPFTVISPEAIWTRITDGAPSDSSVELDMDGAIIMDVGNNLLYGRSQAVWQHWTPDGGSPNFAGLIIDTTDIAFSTSVDSAAVADEVSLGGYEISAGHRALAISSEEVVVVDVDETKFSHKLPVRINGATYNIMLCAT
jgi:hypothetical protein